MSFSWDVLLALLPAIAVAWLAVPPLARRAASLGLVDVPTARSSHATPVPRVGGIAVLLGCAGALLGVAVFGGHAALDDPRAWLAYVVPAALYFAIGLADDRHSLPPLAKFALQACAAAMAVALGLRWAGRAVGPFGALSFGMLTPAMTWLWLVAVVILVNFMDGIDLITSAGAIVVLGAAAGAGAGPGGGLLYLACAGALVGFGFWNVRPARAFPGDAGTHLLGFLMATAALHVPDSTAALPWAVASAPLLPGVIDVALGLAAKRRHGVPFRRAHRQHLHQRLTQVGWSHARVALRYGVLSLASVWLVAWLAPRFGLGACVAWGAFVLGAHLVHALGRTRSVPHTF